MASIKQFLKTLFVPLFLACVVSIAEAHGGSDHSDSDGTTNLRRKSLILVKVYCLIIVFFATFIGGISPCFFNWNHGFLVLGTQFAGGVFLGTATMHFLSDANETFGSLTSKTYPFAFMLACSGYLLTMLGDCVIQWIFIKDTSSPKVDVEMSPAPKATPTTTTMDEDQDATCKCEPPPQNLEAKNFVAATLVKNTNFGDTILLILALCFHSVFEGIAIGVAENSSDAWRALWTISLHKIFAAIAMGIALLRMLPNRPFLQCTLYSLAFGISTPIGVGIGIAIDATAEGPIADWIYAIAMGLACGIFIYVAINHLISKGYVPECKVRLDKPFYKFLAVTLGVGVIAVVMIWD